MSINEHLIAEVNGSMAIEGMKLTEADKSRMLKYLNKHEEFNRIMSELINKHSALSEK